MENKPHRNHGLKRLVKWCRNEFERAENRDYYDNDDFQAAERKFIKYCLINETWSPPSS